MKAVLNRGRRKKPAASYVIGKYFFGQKPFIREKHKVDEGPLLETLAAHQPSKFFDLYCFYLCTGSSYSNPKLSKEAVEDGRHALACAVLEQLKSRSTLSTIVPFRHDVFNFLFHEIGK